MIDRGDGRWRRPHAPSPWTTCDGLICSIVQRLFFRRPVGAERSARTIARTKVAIDSEEGQLKLLSELSLPGLGQCERTHADFLRDPSAPD